MHNRSSLAKSELMKLPGTDDRMLASEERSSARRPKLLIIDDSRTITKLFKHQFERAGYDVVSYSKSPKTIVMIMREKPDLILLDARKPMLDEHMLCMLIKKNKSTAKVPVLLYSSFRKEQIVKRTMECCAQGYVYKTLGADRIIKQISEHISMHGE